LLAESISLLEDRLPNSGRHTSHHKGDNGYLPEERQDCT
jgi:hypothetical protein